MGRGNKLLTSLPTTVFGETFLHLLLFHLISFCKGHLEWYHDMWWELRTKRFINAVFAAILDTFKPVFVTNLFYWGWYFTLLLGCVGCSSGEFGVRFLAIFPDQAEVACGAPCIAAGETVSGVRWNPVWEKKKKEGFRPLQSQEVECQWMCSKLLLCRKVIFRWCITRLSWVEREITSAWQNCY